MRINPKLLILSPPILSDILASGKSSYDMTPEEIAKYQASIEWIPEAGISRDIEENLVKLIKAMKAKATRLRNLGSKARWLRLNLVRTQTARIRFPLLIGMGLS